MDLSQILIGGVILIGLGALVAMAFRPGSIQPSHFEDKNLDGEPDDGVTDADRQAAIEDDGKPLD